MKAFKKIFPVYIAIVVLTIPQISFAGGPSGVQLISTINVTPSGSVLIYGEEGEWNNPDACVSSSYIVLDAGATMYPEMFALLTASFLQGKPIQSYLSGCIYGSRPKLIDVSSYY